MKHIILFIILLFHSIGIFAQCNVNSIRVSTGFNPITNMISYGYGGDPSWIVSSDNDPSTSEPRPATLVNGPWSLSSSTSRWISTGYYGTATSLDQTIPVVFKYEFCINEGVSLDAISANFNLAADDEAELYLNGHHLGGTIYMNCGSYYQCSFSQFRSITVPSSSGFFILGTNSIEIKVKDKNTVVLGAILDGIISGPAGGFSKPNCCNNRIFITGQKFGDMDGNGVKDPYENGIPGWQIKLKNSLGTVIATATTDNNGDYYFSNLPTNPVTTNNTSLLTTGSYVVEETLINGFYQSAPAGSGKYNINITGVQVINNLNFGNVPCMPGFSILASPSPFCLNEPVSFSIVGPPYLMLSNYNFTWNFGDGTTASGPTQTHIYTTGGSKNVSISGGPVMPVECTINTTNITINQSENCCPECLPSFQPIPNHKYLLSAWVSEETLGKESFIDPEIYLKFTTSTGVHTYGPYTAKGNIIDGWQRVEQEFTVPYNATDITVQLSSRAGSGSGQVYFDDVRIHPFDAGFKSYVYDPVTLKFTAELDNNNYATFYEYDEEGKLVRVKKETERKTVTVKESRNSTIKR